MKELALNILDIAQNSITAKSDTVEISIFENDGILTISVSDNGCGMAPEFLADVTSPFTTTRTTRKVGMGIPLLKMAAEMAGGGLSIDSILGEGTTTKAWFDQSHIDLPPMGDIAETIVTLIQGAQGIRFIFTHERQNDSYTLDTLELMDIMGAIPLSSPEVLMWIREYIQEQEAAL